MKKNILWYQPEKLNDDDVIVVNGEKISTGNAYTEYFRELKLLSDKAIKYNSPWCGNISNTFFVKGYFDAVDEHGRNLVFMFLSQESDGRQELYKTIDLLGYHLTTETSNCLKRREFGMGKVLLIAIPILIAIITILLLILND